ncbi:MAG: isoleucine--tRNA ligase [Candidatus Micrarchaeia archaeon]
MENYEEEILKYWAEHNILEKWRAKNIDNKPFYFLDGPPYVSGDLHPGQIWVKGAKDIILRYKRMRGYNVHDRAGYDVHGLPVEHAVEKSMGIKSKKELESKVSVENFVKACKNYVNSLIPKMNKDYARFGIFLDFENAYIPYNKAYIEKAWNILKRLSEKGLLYKESKPLTYCPSCETVLAQGTLEVEYSDEKDPSIFVAFKIDIKNSKPRIEIDEETYLLIWTTTPWTLPANMSVAVNPSEIYIKAKIGDKKLIFAKKRFEAVVANLNESAIVEAEFYGSELEGIYYINPLENEVPIQKKFRKYHKVLFSETMVSMEEGTGIVHIATGHGFDDYKLGKENKIPVFSPIDSHAKYTEEVGRYAGLAVPEEANAKVIEDLERLGSLLNKGTIVHSYPHCWRCGSKLIYKATDQWFLNVGKVRKKLLEANETVNWHPKEAKEWQANVLANSPDWCISRQRFWGIPIPIWKCEKCGNIEVVGSLKELTSKAINKEYVESMDDLHRPYIDNVVMKCSKCGGEMHRISDVFDVWFDSSIAFEASLSDEEFKRLFPADLILEGIDQLRGWFSSMLKSSVMLYKKSPYKEVVVDGMLLAEDGREMHKHLGNYIPISELLKITSADAYRLWFSSHTQWLDIPFSKAELKEAEKVILVLHNISNLINEYSDAIGYKSEKLALRRRSEIDAWIASKLHTLINDVSTSLDSYNIEKANSALRKFILDYFSRFYLKVAKKRVIYGTKKEARDAIDTMRYVFFNVLLLVSPFIPFTAERLYLKDFAYKESIFLEDWPKFRKKIIDPDLERSFEMALSAITAILNSREKAKVRLRWPLSKAVIEVKDEEALKAIEKLSPLIEEYVNVKKLEVKKASNVEKVIKPIFQKIGPEFRENAKIIADSLQEVDPDELEREVSEKGYYLLHTEKGLFNIKPEHFAIVEKGVSTDATKFEYGLVYVDPTLNKGLMDEALYRELARRIQLMRKELGLKKVDKVKIYYRASGELSRIIKEKEKDLAKEVNASSIINLDEPNGKKFEIVGEEIEIKIEKHQ